MTDEELDEFGEVIDEMRADTREYLKANGLLFRSGFRSCHRSNLLT
jgi:hypothetical protein